MEPEPAEPPSAAVEVANGTKQTQVDKAPERRSPLRAEELMTIEDESVLDKMLDQTTDFEERKLIRAALRELRQRKRGREPVAPPWIQLLHSSAAPPTLGSLCGHSSSVTALPSFSF